MAEDLLTHDERVRLECLAQANATLGAPMRQGIASKDVLSTAAHYESYILGSKSSTPSE